MLALSPSEVGMGTPYEFCVGVCYKGGFGSVGITAGVFARMTHWCVHGAIRIWVGAVGMDEVWFVVVGVGVMFSAVVPIFLIIVVMPLYDFLRMFGFLILSYVLRGLLLLLVVLLCPLVFHLEL